VTWDLSCLDWKVRLMEGKSLIPPLPLTSHGDRAVAVYDRLRLADVPGTPALGEASGEWFREIVRAVFGSWDPETRTRYIREIFALVTKKNSKTTYGALGLMLTGLLLNERPRAPFLMTAPVQDTANLAFAAAAGAIALDPVLDKKLHVREHLKKIVHRETKAELEIITFDPKVVTGKKVVAALIDEVHVLGKMARADKALLQLRGGMQPFPEAFLAFITTQSDEPPAGVFKDELQKARDVRDGKRQAAMLSVLYEFPREMQVDPEKPWKDPKNWPLVTPNLGRSITLQRLIDDCVDEEVKGEGALRTWASQHLNVEIGLALMSDSWMGAPFWDAQAIEGGLTLEQLLARCEVAAVGIDGGGLDDLLGLYVLGRERGTGTWLGWGRAWAHEIVLKRRKDVASKLRDLEQTGDLVIVAEPGRDIEELADIVEKIYATGLLDRADDEQQAAIGVDPVGIGLIVEAIEARDVPKDKIIGISQGWKMTGAVKTIERLVAGGGLKHGGQDLMAWCVGNAKVEPRGNAIVITKQASGTAKIDPLMALFDAAHLMALNPGAGGKSFWETLAAPAA
jgi:phage terminase large subunit-like protein